MFCCLPVNSWCMSWAVCSLERATKTDKILPLRRYRVRPHAEKPRNRLVHFQRKKTWSACHASYSARMEFKPRPTCPDGLPVKAYLAFCRKVLARRDMFERRQKIHNCTYIYGLVGYPRAYQNQFREFNSHRVHMLVGTFSCIKK